ncbi:MAG: cob(I)yrinic acid a,c-diamide adenosyltransferase [Wujia sp.]
MIQIYCGDGKGKTTAAVGLAIRAAGHGIPVFFTQFLKDDTSGEINILKKLDGIRVMHPDCFYGFVRNMTEEQRADIQEAYSSLLHVVKEIIESELEQYSSCRAGKYEACDDRMKDRENLDLTKSQGIEMVVVLDEVLHAVNYKLLDELALIELMSCYREKVEFVLTGWNPSVKLLELADYVSEVTKRKHPFDNGIFARNGIEQ